MASRGVLYPKTGQRGGTHFELSDALGFKLGIRFQPDTEKIEKLSKSLADECRKSSADKILISSENFVLYGDISLIGDFLSDYEVKVIIYLRRHDSWWESNYWQATTMVRHPKWVRGVAGYIKFLKNQKNKGARYIWYRAVVDRWAATFGKENIIIRPYEKCQMPEGSVSGILETIGLAEFSQGRLARSAVNVNQSKSLRSLQLIEAYQRADLPDATLKKLIEQAKNLTGDDRQMSIISPGLKLQLLAENFEEYQYLARDYLGREDGQLFYDPLPDINEPWTDPVPLIDLAAIDETVSGVV